MELDRIRDIIANKLQEHNDVWNDVISNTFPGNYGCDEWNVEVSYNDVYADIPNRQFDAKGVFNADLVMGASCRDTSFNTPYNKEFKAKGNFEFSADNNDIIINDVEIDIDPDVF